jgi:hypothetical protein
MRDISHGINQWCGREHELKNTEVKSGAPGGIYSCSILLTAPESHLQSRCFVQIVSMVRVIQLCVLLFFVVFFVLSFFVWLLYGLFFFNLLLLIIPLAFLNIFCSFQ